jgi:hypothetical protein
MLMFHRLLRIDRVTVRDSICSIGLCRIGTLDDVDDSDRQCSWRGHSARSMACGDEQLVRAGRDGARVFHHVGDDLRKTVELGIDRASSFRMDNAATVSRRAKASSALHA